MVRTRECLDEITDLMSSDGESKPDELLNKVADLYLMTADRQSAADQAAFGDVLARIANVVDPIARARFAERMATAETLPKSLLHQLARDEICVARPILQYAIGLREGDLVSITLEVDQDHLVATAHRHDLTCPVTDILVRRGERRVLQAIVQNVSAELSANSIAELKAVVEDHAEIESILRMRRDVPSNPIRRLKRLAASDFWQNVTQALLMTDEGGEPHDQADTVVAETQDAEAEPDQDSMSADGDQPSAEQTVKKPRLQGAALEKHLLEVAKARDYPLVIQALSELAKLDEAMISHCLCEAHVSALMVLCKANRLSPATFTALLQLREARTNTPITDFVGLMRRYEGMTPDTAEKIIRFSKKQGQMKDAMPIENSE